MSTVREALRMLWTALTQCDDHDHIECRTQRHQLGREHERVEGPLIVYPKACPTCGDEIVARPCRDQMLNLAKITLKSALWPRWLTVYPEGMSGPRWRELRWRGHILRKRSVDR